nr:hypothetical protein GCM10020092_070680 [Actinoplanes digitatis]
MLLTATDAGLATSMLSQPIEVPAARDQLRRALGRSGVPQLALRFGYGHPGRPTPPPRRLRGPAHRRALTGLSLA